MAPGEAGKSGRQRRGDYPAASRGHFAVSSCCTPISGAPSLNDHTPSLRRHFRCPSRNRSCEFRCRTSCLALLGGCLAWLARRRLNTGERFGTRRLLVHAKGFDLDRHHHFGCWDQTHVAALIQRKLAGLLAAQTKRQKPVTAEKPDGADNAPCP